jgi:hypothetical protein
MATDGRVSYRLKEKGVDLAPALLELLIWGARHQTTEAPYAAIETMETIAKNFSPRFYGDGSIGRLVHHQHDLG